MARRLLFTEAMTFARSLSRKPGTWFSLCLVAVACGGTADGESRDDGANQNAAGSAGDAGAAGTAGTATAGTAGTAVGGDAGTAGTAVGGDAGTAGIGGYPGGTAGMPGGTAGWTGGTAGHAGFPGGTSGTAGGPFQGRSCGDGAPCAAGSKCTYDGIESGATCNCDPSGHYFCDSWAGGGAPPFLNCNEQSACSGSSGGAGGFAGTGGFGGTAGTGTTSGGCAQTNGFCTKNCECGATCTLDCNGAGPAPGEPLLCDLSYCSLDYWRYGSCSISDGACAYDVDCNFGGEPIISGTCQ